MKRWKEERLTRQGGPRPAREQVHDNVESVWIQWCMLSHTAAGMSWQHDPCCLCSANTFNQGGRVCTHKVECCIQTHASSQYVEGWVAGMRRQCTENDAGRQRCGSKAHKMRPNAHILRNANAKPNTPTQSRRNAPNQHAVWTRSDLVMANHILAISTVS